MSSLPTTLSHMSAAAVVAARNEPATPPAPLPRALAARRASLTNDAREDAGVAYYLVWDAPPADGDRATPLRGDTATRGICVGVKRYGGLYCAACDVSLLADGEEAARRAHRRHVPHCPRCERACVRAAGGHVAESNVDHAAAGPASAAAATDDDATDSASGAPSAPSRVANGDGDDTTALPPATRGVVDDCASFDWLVAPHRLRSVNFKNLLVSDEYGNRCSMSDFMDHIVRPCPIQFYDRIEA